MSWYVGQDGQQVWVGRDEVVYTVVVSSEALPVLDLTYLATHTKKAVYHEHIVSEELADGKSRMPRRQRAKQTGAQRGFIVRTDIDEGPLLRVVPWFKAASQRLLDDETVIRVDADEASNIKKKKGADREKNLLNAGANECRVQTTARINHFAHGPGFRVEVSEGTVTQQIHFFTRRKDMPLTAWTTALLGAIEAAGSLVILARRDAPNEGDAAAGPKSAGGADAGGSGAGELAEGVVRVALRKDKAQQDDDAWLASMMDTCLVSGGRGKEDEEDEEDEGANGNAQGSSVRPPWVPQRREAPSSPSKSCWAASDGSEAASRPAPHGASGSMAAKKPPSTSLSEQLRQESQAPEWRRAVLQEHRAAKGPERHRQMVGAPAAPSAPSRRPAPAVPSRPMVASTPAAPARSAWNGGYPGGPTAAAPFAGSAMASSTFTAARGSAKNAPDDWDGAEVGAALLRQVQGKSIVADRPPPPSSQQARQQQSPQPAPQYSQAHRGMLPQPQQPPKHHEHGDELPRGRWRKQAPEELRKGDDPTAQENGAWSGWDDGYADPYQRSGQDACQQQDWYEREAAPVNDRRHRKRQEADEGDHWQQPSSWYEKGAWHEQEGAAWQPNTRHAPARDEPRRRPRREDGGEQNGAGGFVEEAAKSRPSQRRPHEKDEDDMSAARPAKPAKVKTNQQAQSTCDECGRGKPLTMFYDEGYKQWFCRKCWVAFYGLDPPARQ